MPDDRPLGGHSEVERDNPYERERQFLDERLAPLRPKRRRDDAGAPPAPDETGPEEKPQGRLPRDFRRRLVERYRRRQRAEAEEPPAATAVGATDEGDAPEPPQPLPATRWIPIGPSVVRQQPACPAVSGRVRTIAVAPGGNRVYVGAGNGGVWRSDTAGRTWQSCMESFDRNPHSIPGQEFGSDSLSCGALAIDPIDPDRIYVGTGEGVWFGYFGVGPIVSTDGGRTWQPPEPTASDGPPLAESRFYALAVDPNPGWPGRVVAATQHGLYRREPDSAGGACWTRRWPSEEPPGATTAMTSVVAARTTTTTFYAAGPEGRVLTSTDGETWHVAGKEFPEENVGRVGLAVQPTNTRVVYALVATDRNKLHGLYRLDLATDGTWRKVLGVPGDLFGESDEWGQADHDLAIVVDPVDVNRVYLGGSALLVPIGGTSHTEWCGALYRCAITVSGTTVRATPTYIGASVHADVLALVFAPSDPNTLWVACDGGAFISTNPTASDAVFQPRNTGLATLQMNHFGQHPSEDAVLFCGTQDNGGVRFTGEEAWQYSAAGDGGYFVVNRTDPYQVLSTSTGKGVRRSADGGTRNSYDDVNVPLKSGEKVRFYAPLAGTPPPTPALTPAEAEAEAKVVAFGSIRPWISYEFGGLEPDRYGNGDWQSIPTGDLADDKLEDDLGDDHQGGGVIRSLAFASSRTLYAGTMGGGVYRFEATSGGWRRDRLDNLGDPDHQPPVGPVTDIAVDPKAEDGRSIYITFGGIRDDRQTDNRHGKDGHVWHFDGIKLKWEERCGPAGDEEHSLLDVHTNAIVVDPVNPTHLYVGADIGVWRSTDSGATWRTFSRGLPDAAVIDLVLHPGRRLLRAATHGRSVYECRIDAPSLPAVELYVRDTQLDTGRVATVDRLCDPTRKGRDVFHWAGPDIKLDTPDAAGHYQLPIRPPATDFWEFTDTLTDDIRNLATYASETATTRVFVQVHNRGVSVLGADNVQVMLLVANAPAALPALPPGFATKVRSGTPINTPDWQTVGTTILDGVQPGVPKIAAFDLTSDKLPAPDQPAGENHPCVLALIHHPKDPFSATQTDVDLLSLTDRKAAHKHLKALQFVGTWQAPPPEAVGMWTAPPPAILRVRLNNANADHELLTDLVVELGDVYPVHDYEVYDGVLPRRGRVRVVLPTLHLDGDLEQHLQGLWRTDDDGDFKFKEWAQQQRELLNNNKKSQHPYNKVFVRQQIDEIDHVLADDMVMLQAYEDRTPLAVRRIKMAPGDSHTVFLLFDRPTKKGGLDPVRAFNVDVLQCDSGLGTLRGGVSARIELAWPAIYYPR